MLYEPISIFEFKYRDRYTVSVSAIEVGFFSICEKRKPHSQLNEFIHSLCLRFVYILCVFGFLFFFFAFTSSKFERSLANNASMSRNDDDYGI